MYKLNKNKINVNSIIKNNIKYNNTISLGHHLEHLMNLSVYVGGSHMDLKRT